MVADQRDGEGARVHAGSTGYLFARRTLTTMAGPSVWATTVTGAGISGRWPAAAMHVLFEGVFDWDVRDYTIVND